MFPVNYSCFYIVAPSGVRVGFINVATNDSATNFNANGAF